MAHYFDNTLPQKPNVEPVDKRNGSLREIVRSLLRSLEIVTRGDLESFAVLVFGLA